MPSQKIVLVIVIIGLDPRLHKQKPAQVLL